MNRLNKAVITIPNAIFFESIMEILALGKTAKFNLRGHSMRPFLHENDQIILISIDLQKLKRGQIALARYQNNYVLHRVVHIRENTVWLAGDGNVAQLEKIPVEDLIAGIQKVYRGKQEIHVTSRFQELKGLVWYYLRPIRYVVKKLFGTKL
ncbi:S24/S26 family peptidase [Sphingobacterium sp. SRCM116780]|uniref:S24/S26 family peptidase n=1 Tax=Sphingobacterium sp. SRCM116780 TaxID=2907623 RepID=UPI001F24A09A|nr:S24/S26 family peptidase [Sphingobacterium sp. SRCM116780]UIR55997.1 S24/S26 family peptidase [Sphingobacterium sp. SRCM116780]